MLLKRVNPVPGRIVFPAILAVALSLVLAGPSMATKYAGTFMENGGGARALGMGGAFTAVADDPSATFWNPAGLAQVQTTESLFGGESAGIGISLIRLGVDDIPFTDHLTDQLDTNHDGTVDDSEILGLFDLQDEIRYKSDQELALLFSYGESLGDWKVGASAKFIRQSVGEYSSLGVGIDVGILRPNLWRNLDFGVKFQDLTTTYLHWSTGRNEIITPAIVPGLAWRQPFPQWNISMTMAYSMETRFDNRRTADQYSAGSMSWNNHLGMEIGFSEKVFLRGGFDSGWETKNLTAGAGFRINPLTIDYAYAGDSLDIDEVTHRISLSVRF